MSDYENIGGGYNLKRAADPRIARGLVEALGLTSGSAVADIGAGTGNYPVALAGQGLRIIAVEPSKTMREQAPDGADIEWHSANAEALPLQDGSVDGLVCVLAVHHFSNPEVAFTEMHRVCSSGPVVIFTFDPRAGDPTWIADYFPTIWEKAFPAFPPIADLETQLSRIFDREVRSKPFPLPHDLKDHFAGAGWNRPEIYLEPEFRASMSPFASEDSEIVSIAVSRLEKDLESGKWDESYGSLRTSDSHDLGYRFVHVLPKEV